LWNPMIHCSFHQSPILDPVLILMNPFDTVKPFFLSLSLSLSSTSIYISRYNHHPEIQVMDTISYGTSLYNRYLDSGSYKIPFLLWCILILATSRWEIYDGRDVTTAPPVRGQSVRDRLPCPVTNKDVEEVTLKEI
jgi:hypothetical protein